MAITVRYKTVINLPVHDADTNRLEQLTKP